MANVLSVRPQNVVLFDLEPDQTSGLTFWTGEVTGAFNISNRRNVRPGECDQVGWAPKSGIEPRTGQPMSSPFTGSTAMVFGDGMIGGNMAAGGTYTFEVDRPNMAFVISTLLIVQDPGHGHKHNPFWKWELRDADNRVVECGTYSVVSAGTQQGWNMVQSGLTDRELRKMNEKNADPRAFVFFRPWHASLVPLNDFVGMRMSLTAMVGDCDRGAHGAMVYWDLQLIELAIEKQGALSCDDITGVKLTGPPGAVNYHWSNKKGRSWTGQTIMVDEAGEYELVYTAETGCSGTLSVVVDNALDRPASQGIVTTGTLNCDSGSVVVLTAQENANGYQWSTGAITQSISIKDPGLYTVLRPGAPGRDCDQEDRVIVPAELSLPDPTFSTNVNEICEGGTVQFKVKPIPPALSKKVTRRIDFGDGEVSNSELGSHQYVLPGIYIITQSLERGQCAVEHQQEIVVQSNPVPELGIGVECHKEERTFMFSPLGMGPNDDVWFNGATCDGRELPFERKGEEYRGPLDPESCARFKIKIRTPLGCEGNTEQEFTAPEDPVAGAAVHRIGGVDEFIFSLKDTSKFAEKVHWATGVAKCIWDSLHRTPIELRFDNAGTFLVHQLVIGAQYTCPDSIVMRIHSETSFTSQWGLSSPRPTRFIRTLPKGDCNDYSPHSNCTCARCAERRK